ncbi:MAG: hypothetical protein QOF48_4036 [Verrucomicrobiota bacterium]
MPQVLFLVGDEEYKTGETVPEWANQELVPRGVRCIFVIDDPKKPATLEGLSRLADADVLFISLKRRALTPEQFAILRRHLDAGKPVLGIRTASHAFGARNPEPGRESWDTFDRDVFGGNYQNHYGKGPPTIVRIAPASAAHPILAGLPRGELKFSSHLYLCRDLAATTRVLLNGGIEGRPEVSEPVAWINTNANRRIFYTSLGSPEDFKEPAFRHLLLNAVLWAAGLPPVTTAPTKLQRAESGAPVADPQAEKGAVSKPFPGHKMSERNEPLSPAEAARTFSVPPDLEIEQVLSEPEIVQPVFLNFDERGRMWVVEYRQYPAPAGLKVVSHDNFWRAVYDRVPEPPPRGPRGLDRISIHEDTNGDGTYDKHKVFVDGLNIATSCVKGRGGVWVLNPPYLLFYPDKNNDDIPDGAPVVHLEGFGLEDTHSVVNSLRWGPDGWLYAAQGSTVTANVRVVAPPGSRRDAAQTQIGNRQSSIGNSQRLRTSAAVTNRVYSQGQNIWRYHPEKRIYEIFAEGGGNAFGVEFDDKGRLFSGHNGGDTRGFHYMQGAYLRKGFEKHGELSNPYAFGYFPQMDGTKGERFSHTFLIYHGGALPPRYEGKLFGCEPLQSRIVLSEITPDGSTFKTRDLERVVTSSDSWFRPVDIKAGPDGAIYIADWYDRQVTHTRNQEGNIDRSNGRIYRLKKKGAQAIPPFDLGKLPRDGLHRTLGSDNQWVRQTAQRLIADRHDSTPPFSTLTNLIDQHGTEHSLRGWLEVLWAGSASGRLEEKDFLFILTHGYFDSSPTLAWSVRLLGDERHVSPAIAEKVAALALKETNPEVRAQLACTAIRLPAVDALPIVRNLILSSTRDANSGLPLPATQERGEGKSRTKPASSPRPSPPAAGGEGEDARDSRLPLLLWWAIESKCESDRDAVLKLFEDSTLWSIPIVEQHLLDRLMRRFAAAGTRKDLLTCARLLDLAPSQKHSEKLMKGFEEAFKGRSLAGLPNELVAGMARHNVGSQAFKLRTGDIAALTRALAVITDSKVARQRRQEFIEVLGEIRPREALNPLLRVADDERDPQLRKAALTALLGYDDSRIPAVILKDYNAYVAEVRSVALTLLSSRIPWALALVDAVDSGRIKPADVPLETVRRIQAHADGKLAGLIAKHWSHAGRPTTEAMRQQIQRLSGALRNGKADPYAGQKLFNSTCASCHTLFARGGHVGPDLTTYQRGDVDSMLLHVVNPSAEIREGFENILVETRDDRSLTGFLVERDAHIVVLRGLDGQNVVLDQKDIVEMRAAGMSLMPEGLLDAMTEQQVRDLFAYLRSTQPLAN